MGIGWLIHNILSLADASSSYDFEATPGDSPFSDNDFIQKVFPQGIWDFVVQLIAFILLILIVIFLAYKPVRKMLQKRKDYVASTLEDAANKQKEAALAYERKDQIVLEGKEEASRIISEAKAQAEKEASRILSEAELASEEKRRQADLEIEAAKEKTREQLQGEIVDLALQASNKILGREVSEEDNRRLVEDFVSNLDKEGKA